jgi:purine-nucleoside phosphorylase
MPGDPLRARHIAENYLEGGVQINGVRNMLGFTGNYKGKRLSVMASGMGGPSMGIYSFELFAIYDVDSIVRIGTCGALSAAVEVGDLVFAMTASTDSNYAAQYRLNGNLSPCCDHGLLERGVAAARQRGLRHWVGGILSSDHFSRYNALGAEEGWKKWASMGCAATDMESFALYCNAAYLGRKALSILTCAGSNVLHKEMSAEERQTSLEGMFEVGLELA